MDIKNQFDRASNSGFTEVISLNNIFYFANENTEAKAT